MAASKHSEDDFAAPRRGGSRTVDTAPIASLVDHGMRLRLRAPELAMVFGERAAALAEAAGTERLWAYAEGLAVFARIRLGQRASVVSRAVAVLRTAEADGHHDLVALMRTELALCARSVGVPLTGLAALRPVLADDDASAAHRAAALLQMVGCMAPLGRRGVLDRSLREADELASSDSALDDGDRAVLQAMVCTGTAAHQRRHGDWAASMESTQRGLAILGDGLGDGVADGVYVRGRLMLERVCALLDRGEAAEAVATAAPLFAGPMRAAAVAPMAWMRLAVATRVHLPNGAAEAADALVRDALYSTQRHELKALTGRLWLELAHIEESLGRPAEAVTCLREARMNEHAYNRERRQALGLLIGEFGRGEQHVVDFPRSTGARVRTGRNVPSQRKAAQRAVAVADPAPSAVEVPAAEPPAIRDAESPAVEPEMPSPLEAATPEAALEAEAEYKPAAAEPEGTPEAAPSTDSAGSRHRANEASARAVLERLGVTVGSGGRRRAREDPASPRGEQPAEQPEEPAESQDPEPVDAVAEATPDAAPPPAERKKKDLDSVLAVFSNWADGDESEPSVVKPRVRGRLRHQATAGSESGQTNGRVVNGDNPVSGKHRGEG